MWNMGVPLQYGLSDNSSQQCDQNSSESFVTSEGYWSHPRSMPPNLPPPVSNHALSTPSVFYVADRYMGIPQFDCQTGTLPLFTSLQKSSSEISSPVNQGQGSQVSANLAKQNGLCPEDISESVAKFPSQGNMNSIVADSFGKPVFRNSLGTEFWPSSPSNIAGARFVFDARSNGSSEAFPHSNIGSYSSAKQPSYFQLQAQRGLTEARAGTPVTSNPATPSVPCKTRIRWNPELHQRFVDSVNRLGGADKATPKGVLKLMGTPGLTIYHVKSHLQKYRIAKYLPDSAEAISDYSSISFEDKFEKRASTNEVPHLDLKTSTQISEALRLQLDVQRRLHEQLEAQRNMQLRIEEQGKQLRKMFEEQQKVNHNRLEAQSSEVTPSDDHPIPLGDVQGSEYN